MKNILYKLFLVYLTFLIGIYCWAGISGTRLLGDGVEDFSPQGRPTPSSSGSSGYHRFYHK